MKYLIIDSAIISCQNQLLMSYVLLGGFLAGSLSWYKGNHMDRILCHTFIGCAIGVFIDLSLYGHTSNALRLEKLKLDIRSRSGFSS